MKYYSRFNSIILGLALVFTGGLAFAENEDDYLGYPVGSTVEIWINWDTFEEQGIPSSWKLPFEDAVINGYTRLVQVASFNLKPKFMGYTTRTSPANDEIIIYMNEKHATSTRLASRFGKPAKIVFHRKSGQTNTEWNFTPYRAASGEYDMQAIVTHELAHAFGLEHNTNGISKSIMGSYDYRARFGPFSEDIADLQAQYNQRTDLDVKIQRSTNSGDSWASYSSNITGLNITTTNTPTAVRDPDRSIFFFTSPSKKPSWIVGNSDGNSFDSGKWWIYGGYRSVYGVAAAGWSNEYMMAWVDDTDSHKVKMVYSNNNGAESFSWRNPPSTVRTYGTPALHKFANNTWLLGYTKYDTSSRDETGKVAVRVSTNDGSSWGDEVVLNDFYRAEGGVTITSDGGSDIRIGFAWSRKSDQSGSDNQLVRTIRAHLSGANIVYDGMIYGSNPTRTQPSFAKNSVRMLQSWRETNSQTSLNTYTSTIGSSSWENYERVVTSSPVSPALTAYKGLSYAFLYYLE